MCVWRLLIMAQCIIADMEFTEADTEEDRALKIRVLQVYNK